MVATNKDDKYSIAERPDHNLKHKIVPLIAVILVAILMRMLAYTSVTAHGGITFFGFDEYYHMRRILSTTYNFPHILNFDSYLNYPYGFQIGWPPFFDLLGALLAKILGAGQPALHTIEIAGSILPVILGVLTIIPLYIATEAVFDRKTGLLGALIFAVMPAHIYVSQFGESGHHVAETLLATAAFASFILALKCSKERSFSLSSLKYISSEKRLLKPLAFAVLSGLFLAIFVFTWLGALIFISFIVLYISIQTIIDLKARKQSDYIFICSSVCLLTTLLFTIPMSAGYTRPGLEMSAMYLSWFQTLYVFCMIVAILLLWGLSLYVSKKDLDWIYYPGILILLLSASFLILRFFAAGSYAYVIEGINFFSGKSEYLGTISEAMPLFLTSQGHLSFAEVFGAFGLCFPTALAAFFLLGLEWKGENSKPERTFFLLWTLFSAYLALTQRRFVYQLAVNVSILTAYILLVFLNSFDFENEVRKLVKFGQKTENNSSHSLQLGKEIKAKAKSKLKTKNVSMPKKVQKPDYFKLITSFIFIGLVFVPCIWMGNAFAQNAGSFDPGWKESLVWLKNSSPETSYYLQPSQTPEYGVLSWWDYGNWIVYIAQRPAISNNFQTGVEDSAHFFMTDSEQEAKAIMDKLKVKYVITDTLMSAANGKFSAIAQIAGKNAGDYYDVQQQIITSGRQVSYQPKKELFNLELSKLHMLDGSNLGNLRLVHESNVSKGEDGKNNAVKVFEYVPGAKLSGTAAPNQPVIASLNLRSNTGRQFTYQNRAVADKNGSFEVTVPYSTENTGGGVSALSAYSLNAGVKGTVAGIQVKERDVLNGNILAIKNFPL
jgi:oligosaccharyl transferase (archaeosortase A-associated)